MKIRTTQSDHTELWLNPSSQSCSNAAFILTFINEFPEKAKQAQIRNQTVNQ